MKSLIVVASILVSGCSSELIVSDTDLNGLPISEPVLTRIITKTTYEVLPKFKVDQDAVELCSKFTTEEDYKFLPLGRTRYVNFKPSHFGKGEFKVEYGDNGGVKSVSLNSDPSAMVEASNGLISTILPFLGRPQVRAAGAQVGDDERSEKCLTKSTTIVKIEKMNIDGM